MSVSAVITVIPVCHEVLVLLTVVFCKNAIPTVGQGLL
jgi:hypothetical protein